MKLSEVIARLQVIQTKFGEVDPDCDGTVQDVNNWPYEIVDIVTLVPGEGDESLGIVHQDAIAEPCVCIRIAYHLD